MLTYSLLSASHTWFWAWQKPEAGLWVSLGKWTLIEVVSRRLPPNGVFIVTCVGFKLTSPVLWVHTLNHYSTEQLNWLYLLSLCEICRHSFSCFSLTVTRTGAHQGDGPTSRIPFFDMVEMTRKKGKGGLLLLNFPSNNSWHWLKSHCPIILAEHMFQEHWLILRIQWHFGLHFIRVARYLLAPLFYRHPGNCVIFELNYLKSSGFKRK